jgi:hypothetical protein
VTIEDDLGVLVQRCAMPAAAGMEAIEARIVAVQEVPPKQELQFFAVRGDARELLTKKDALTAIREHVPRRSIAELTEAELLMEVLVLRAENDRMKPVYEAARIWRRARGLGEVWDARQRLIDAVDASTREDP